MSGIITPPTTLRTPTGAPVAGTVILAGGSGASVTESGQTFTITASGGPAYVLAYGQPYVDEPSLGANGGLDQRFMSNTTFILTSINTWSNGQGTNPATVTIWNNTLTTPITAVTKPSGFTTGVNNWVTSMTVTAGVEYRIRLTATGTDMQYVGITHSSGGTGPFDAVPTSGEQLFSQGLGVIAGKSLWFQLFN